MTKVNAKLVFNAVTEKLRNVPPAVEKKNGFPEKPEQVPSLKKLIELIHCPEFTSRPISTWAMI